MEQQSAFGNDPTTTHRANKDDEASPEDLREVLTSVVEIGASLRLQMDINTLLKRIVITTCKALHFRYAVIYLADAVGFFRVMASSGIGMTEEDYLRHHPLPDHVVARMIDERFRISDSYFLPAEAPIWQEEDFVSYFVLVDDSTETLVPVASSSFAPAPYQAWRPEDLLVVPLIGGNGTLLGFLTPDAPLNGRRPTRETMSLFELFANQAAVAIEGARLSSELREAVRLARESERIKNNFLMIASHELRTPLTAVQGYLELLGDYAETLDEESKARFIQNARRGCDELVLLLGNVLDTTSLDGEHVILKPSLVRLAQSTQAILEILEPILAREHRPVQVQIAQDVNVWADELRLRQILLNVLGNALKYTPPGSQIALTAEESDGEQIPIHWPPGSGEASAMDRTPRTFVVLSIRDWGPGVAPEEQARLFTRFMRLEAARKSSQHGAGLGLYLCRQLLMAMGGAIWMESSGVWGEGSTFFVALPKGKAENEGV